MSEMKMEGRILLVLDGDSSEPVAYTNPIYGEVCNLRHEVKYANDELDLRLTEEQINDICYNLSRGCAHWIEEKWCFDIVYF